MRFILVGQIDGKFSPANISTCILYQLLEVECGKNLGKKSRLDMLTPVKRESSQFSRARLIFVVIFHGLHLVVGTSSLKL